MVWCGVVWGLRFEFSLLGLVDVAVGFRRRVGFEVRPTTIMYCTAVF